MDRKSGYIRSSSISVSSPSDCSISGGGERGNAPGNAWDGDKMEGVCLLLPATERVAGVDQPTDEESVEKKEPRKEVLVLMLVLVLVLVGECCSVVAVVVDVVLGISTSTMLVGGSGAGCKEESAYGTSFTSNGVSTTRWNWLAQHITAQPHSSHVGG